MKLSIIYLVLTCLSISQNKRLYYPNCVLDTPKFVEIDSDYNRKFIQLTSFLFEEDEGVYLKNKIEVLNQNDLKNSTYAKQDKIKYILLISVIATVCVLIIFVRARAPYVIKMRLNIQKTLGSKLNPCLILSAVLTFSFVIFFMSTLNSYPNQIQTSYCAKKHIEQIILQGKNQSNWAGLYGIQKIINLRIAYLETIQSMNGSYDFNVRSIKLHKNERCQFAKQLSQQYGKGQIVSANQKVNFSTLLPALFDTKQLLNKINASEWNFVTISNLIIDIENGMSDAYVTNNQTRISLQTKIPQFLMSAEAIKEAKSKQDQYTLMYNIDQLIILASRIFISISLQSACSYLIIMLLAMKFRHSLLRRFTNLIWVIFILILLFSIFLLFLLSLQGVQYSKICPQYQQIITNQTYYNIIANQNINNNNSIQLNTYKMFAPCLFSSNQQILQFANYNIDSYGLLYVMNKLSKYIDIMNPIHRTYINILKYSQQFNNSIKYIKQQQYNVHQNWNYINNLLTDMNKYTLNNINNDKCYKHRWVFDSSQCGPNQDILQYRANNLLLSSSLLYASVAIKCIPLNQRNQRGQLSAIANYTDIISNYLHDIHDSRCIATIHQIQNISLLLTNAMINKFNSLQPIIDMLVNQRYKLDDMVRVIRTNYLLKKQQFNYMHTLGYSIPLSTQTMNNWNYATQNYSNCSCIKHWAFIYFQNQCLDKRATVVELFLILLAIQGSLCSLIIIGGVYGCTEDIKEQQLRLPQQSMSDLERLSDSNRPESELSQSEQSQVKKE